MEQKKIVDTLVRTENNSIWGTDGGNDTKDKVFLLSIEEVEEVFGDIIICGMLKIDILNAMTRDLAAIEDSTEEANKKFVEMMGDIDVLCNAKVEWAKETEYAQGNKNRIMPYLSWWLRSPGEESNEAAEIHFLGGIVKVGESITMNDMGVRPAMWIKL